MPKKLFVSYRRKSLWFTDKLTQSLKRKLAATIFIDFTGINETNFESNLLKHLVDSDAVLVVISEHTFDESRIHQDKDWVRREIALALELNKPIILALVDDIKPPDPSKLPENIRAIVTRQGISFYPSPKHFETSINDLVDFIVKATPIRRRKPLLPILLIGVMVAIFSIIMLILNKPISTLAPFDFDIQPSSGPPGTRIIITSNVNSHIGCQFRTDQTDWGNFTLSSSLDGKMEYWIDQLPNTKLEFYCIDPVNKRNSSEEGGRQERFFLVTNFEVETVLLGSFQIDAKLVSAGDFAVFANLYDYNEFPITIKPPQNVERISSPYRNVTWYEADAYCRWRDNARLPSEDAWKQAASELSDIGNAREWVSTQIQSGNQIKYVLLSWLPDENLVERAEYKPDYWYRSDFGFRCLKENNP